MKENAPPMGKSGARNYKATTSSNPTVAIARSPAQDQSATVAHIGAIWKSPRDKRQCIEANFKTFNGSPPYLDLRILELDASGRMRPTAKGITISPQRLAQLAKLLGDAARMAQKLGMVSS